MTVHLRDLVGREAEQVAADESWPAARGHLVAEQERCPGRQRRREDREDVEGDHTAEQARHREHEQRGAWWPVTYAMFAP